VRWTRRWLADVVTATRLFAAPFLVAALWSGAARAALLLVAIGGVSDLADGWVARRMQSASERGRWFDHMADITFLLSGFAALAWIGEISPLAPLAIGAAFAFYVVDSLRRSDARSLVASRLGHLSGVMNYIVLGTVVFALATDGALIPGWLTAAAVASVPVYSAAAVAARLAAPRRGRS
jgi:phosphatidylglycerophosphate synthase